MRRAKLWRRSVGSRPFTVVAFERRPGGPISLRWWDSSLRNGQGNARWRALGHADREKAIAEAHELAAKLRRGEEAAQRGETTLARLLVEYERHRTSRKTAAEQAADARRVELWTRRLGADRPVTRITLADWESFIDARASGQIDARGVTIETRLAEWDARRKEAAAQGRPFTEPKPEPKPVRARTVEVDAKWLRLVLSWGTRWRDRGGNALVSEDVTGGWPLPREKNPRRPVASTDRLEKLLAVADQVHPDLPDLLVIAAGTGRRLNAVVNLKHGDVDRKATKVAPYGTIFWSKEFDKMGRDATVPMSPDVRAALDRIRDRRPSTPAAKLFPHPRDASRAVGRHLPDQWLRKAEALAGLKPQEGSLWHAYRRAWATARKHLPATDVAKAGGWKTVSMVSEVYTQADDETTLAVVLGGAEIREIAR
jgi:hypothetical protein